MENRLIRNYIRNLTINLDVAYLFPAKPIIKELEYVIREKIPKTKLKQLKLVR
jgi:hypothetical protein